MHHVKEHVQEPRKPFRFEEEPCSWTMSSRWAAVLAVGRAAAVAQRALMSTVYQVDGGRRL